MALFPISVNLCMFSLVESDWILMHDSALSLSRHVALVKVRIENTASHRRKDLVELLRKSWRVHGILDILKTTALLLN